MLESPSQVLWRQGNPIHPPTMALLAGHDGISADPDNMALQGVETARVVGPLNRLLHGVPMPASVQDGFHVKVVQLIDFLEFRAVEGPLDRLASSISPHVDHMSGVSYGIHMKYILWSVALVAFGKLSTGLAHPDQVAGWEAQMALASTGFPKHNTHWSSSLCKGPYRWRLLVKGGALAYLENMSMQQKLYLVPSLATRYSLQSTRLHCSCSPGQDTMVFHREKQ